MDVIDDMNSDVTDIIIFGAGSHAREILQLIRAINRSNPSWNCLGFAVDKEYVSSAPREIHDLPVLLIDQLASEDAFAIVIGVGNPMGREKIVLSLKARGYNNFPSLVHPNAWVGDGVDIEEGVIIFSGVSITTDIHIGRHTHINLGCTISHDTIFGPFTTLGPGVNVSGNVKIGERVDVGTGASIIPKISIGADCIIGAGAAVVRSIPPNSVAVGVPARIIKKNLS